MSHLDPTDADFEAVFTRRFMGGAKAWQSIKADARKAAAERLLATNAARRTEIATLLPQRTGEPYIALQDEFTRLLTEHEALMRVAFPTSYAQDAREP